MLVVVEEEEGNRLQWCWVLYNVAMQCGMVTPSALWADSVVTRRKTPRIFWCRRVLDQSRACTASAREATMHATIAL